MAREWERLWIMMMTYLTGLIFLRLFSFEYVRKGWCYFKKELLWWVSGVVSVCHGQFFFLTWKNALNYQSVPQAKRYKISNNVIKSPIFLRISFLIKRNATLKSDISVKENCKSHAEVIQCCQHSKPNVKWGSIIVVF